MSLLSSIGSFAKGAWGAVKTAAGSALGSFFGVPGGQQGVDIALGAGGIARPMGTPPITTAGTAAGGVTQTLPWGLPKGGGFGGVPAKVGTPNSPPGAGTSIAQQLGNMLGQGAAGFAGGAGLRGVATKRGRLTGNAIPRGYVERMSQTGVVYLAKQGRRRGISPRDLSAFYRVNRLVSKIHARAARAPRHKGR